MSGFCLRLADGQHWHLTSSRTVQEWLREFAATMNLRRCRQMPRHGLVFLRKGEFRNLRGDLPGLSASRSEFPLTGWSFHDVPFLRFRYHPRLSDVVCELGEHPPREALGTVMAEALFPVFRETVHNGGQPIHAALIGRRRYGVLLGGTGGIGKSTAAKRMPAPWRPLSDDRALIVRTGPRRYVAHPLPTWSEAVSQGRVSPRRVQTAIPLKGIFILHRGVVDRASIAGRSETMVRLSQLAREACGVGWMRLLPAQRREFNLEILNRAQEIIAAVPTYSLEITLTGRFWKVIERALFLAPHASA